MSTPPEVRPATEPAIFGEAPPRSALVLAGLDFAAAAALVFIIVASRGAEAADAGLDGATPHQDFWTGWFILVLLVGFFLMLISVASLVTVPVRSEPRIFRVLLGGTLTFALVIPVYVALYQLGLSF